LDLIDEIDDSLLVVIHLREMHVVVGVRLRLSGNYLCDLRNVLFIDLSKAGKESLDSISDGFHTVFDLFGDVFSNHSRRQLGFVLPEVDQDGVVLGDGEELAFGDFGRGSGWLGSGS
jgi:hypothetical protein